MARNVPPDETIKYWRLGILLLDVSTPVLRKLLRSKIQALSNGVDDINAFLKKEEHKRKLQRLDSRVLPNVLKEKLYPPNQENTQIETWDICLLCVVLKQLFNLSQQELQYLDELRQIRNREFAHRPNGRVEEEEFSRTWTHIEVVIGGLLDIIDDSSFTCEMKAKIQHYKECDLQQPEIDRAMNFFGTYCKFKTGNERYCDLVYHQAKRKQKSGICLQPSFQNNLFANNKHRPYKI